MNGRRRQAGELAPQLGGAMVVYEREVNPSNQTITFTVEEKMIYGSSRLGVLNDSLPMLGSQNSTYTQSLWSHVIGKRTYELSNHLGNVLSVISDKPIPHDNGSGTADYFMADIRQAQDYSPFGVTLQGRNFTASGADGFRFGFNGMEADDELKGDGNSYDFGARMLDPRLGRWLTIDALTAKYPDLNPYNFALNSPVLYKDPDGNDAIVTITTDASGKKVATIKSTVYVAGTGVNSDFVTNLQEVFDINFGDDAYAMVANINGEEIQLKVEVEFVDLMSIPSGQATNEQRSLQEYMKARNSGTEEHNVPAKSKGDLGGLEYGNNMLIFDNSGMVSSSDRVKSQAVISMTTKDKGSKKTRERGVDELTFHAIHEIWHLFGLTDRYNADVKSGKYENHEGFEFDWMSLVTGANDLKFTKMYSPSDNGVNFSQAHVDNLVKAIKNIVQGSQYQTPNGSSIYQYNYGRQLDSDDPNRQQAVINGESY